MKKMQAHLIGNNWAIPFGNMAPKNLSAWSALKNIGDYEDSHVGIFVSVFSNKDKSCKSC